MSGGKFNLRVAAVIRRNSKILVMTGEDSPYFYLPGGRLKLHETSVSALRREISEELHEQIQSLQLLWVVENFFRKTQSDEDFHEICFFYESEIKPESAIYDETSFSIYEEGRKNVFNWVYINELDDIDLLPMFLKEKLTHEISGVHHFVFPQDSGSTTLGKALSTRLSLCPAQREGKAAIWE